MKHSDSVSSLITYFHDKCTNLSTTLHNAMTDLYFFLTTKVQMYTMCLKPQVVKFYVFTIFVCFLKSPKYSNGWRLRKAKKHSSTFPEHDSYLFPIDNPCHNTLKVSRCAIIQQRVSFIIMCLEKTLITLSEALKRISIMVTVVLLWVQMARWLWCGESWVDFRGELNCGCFL